MKPRMTTREKITFAAVTLTVIAAWGGLVYHKHFVQPYEPAKRPAAVAEKPPSCPAPAMAYQAVKHIASERLRSPSTAKFPRYDYRNPQVRSVSECRYRASTYVDAHNAFGATIRNRVSMDLEYRMADERWYATAIVIE